MSEHPMYRTRRKFQETRRQQFDRLTDIFQGAIALGKSAVVVPATDYPLLLELLAKAEPALREAEIRTTRLEVIDLFKEAV